MMYRGMESQLRSLGFTVAADQPPADAPASEPRTATVPGNADEPYFLVGSREPVVENRMATELK